MIQSNRTDMFGNYSIFNSQEEGLCFIWKENGFDCMVKLNVTERIMYKEILQLRKELKEAASKVTNSDASISTMKINLGDEKTPYPYEF